MPWRVSSMNDRARRWASRRRLSDLMHVLHRSVEFAPHKLPLTSSNRYSHTRLEIVGPEITVKVKNAVPRFPPGNRSSDIQRLA